VRVEQLLEQSARRFPGKTAVICAGGRHTYAEIDVRATRLAQTLRLGDGITRPGAWGQTVRFGGLQWGTNFAEDFDTGFKASMWASNIEYNPEWPESIFSNDTLVREPHQPNFWGK